MISLPPCGCSPPNPKVRLIDLTEWDPPLDPTDLSALTAARWVAECLAGFEGAFNEIPDRGNHSPRLLSPKSLTHVKFGFTKFNAWGRASDSGRVPCRA